MFYSQGRLARRRGRRRSKWGWGLEFGQHQQYRRKASIDSFFDK